MQKMTENLNNDQIIKLRKENDRSMKKENLRRRNMAAVDTAKLGDALKGNTSLTDLDISHNSLITDEMFQPLLEGIQKSNLKHLDITALELLSEKTRNELRAICRDKKIDLKEKADPQMKPKG